MRKILLITEAYYSCWLGSPENLFSASPAVTYLYSAERNKVQTGYGQQFDLWVLVTSDRVFLSYGDAASAKIEELKAVLDGYCPVEEAAQKIERIYGSRPQHSVKYVFRQAQADGSAARCLRSEDYPAYEAFFRKNNPDCSNVSWLKEYFEEMVAENLCCGVFRTGELVSCTDSPSVPYMAELVREVGIHTLDGERGKGYAKAAVSLCVREILKNGKCPVWSADAENTGSRILAERSGFVPFADCLFLSLV